MNGRFPTLGGFSRRFRRSSNGAPLCDKAAPATDEVPVPSAPVTTMGPLGGLASKSLSFLEALDGSVAREGAQGVCLVHGRCRELSRAAVVSRRGCDASNAVAGMDSGVRCDCHPQ